MQQPLLRESGTRLHTSYTNSTSRCQDSQARELGKTSFIYSPCTSFCRTGKL